MLKIMPAYIIGKALVLTAQSTFVCTYVFQAGCLREYREQWGNRDRVYQWCRKVMESGGGGQHLISDYILMCIIKYNTLTKL